MRSRDYVISRFTNPNNTSQPTPPTSARRRNFPTTSDWERDHAVASPAMTQGVRAGSDQTPPVTSGLVEPKR